MKSLERLLFPDYVFRAAFSEIPGKQNVSCFGNLIPKPDLIPSSRAALNLFGHTLPIYLCQLIARTRPNSDEISEIETFRRYLDSSLHYALELRMQESVIRSWANRESQAKEKLLNSHSQESKLLWAHTMFFYSWFCMDDLTDNSLHRGHLPAYHERVGTQTTERVYAAAVGEFKKCIGEFSSDQASQLSCTLDYMDAKIKSDTSDDYYKIDLERTQNPSVMRQGIRNKCLMLASLSADTVSTIIGRDTEPACRETVASASEAMWIANDLKDLTQPGVSKWAELKSGRINYPLALMLSRLPVEINGVRVSREQIVDAVKEIWDSYRSLHCDKELTFDQKIQQMTEIDRRPEIQARFSLIQKALLETGTVSLILRDINERIQTSKSINQSLGGLDFLTLYGAGTDYYVREKQAKLCRIFPQLILDL